MFRKKKFLLVLLCFAAVLAPLVDAAPTKSRPQPVQGDDAPPPPGEEGDVEKRPPLPRRPPREAMASGAACSFQTPEGEIMAGTCPSFPLLRAASAVPSATFRTEKAPSRKPGGQHTKWREKRKTSRVLIDCGHPST